MGGVSQEISTIFPAKPTEPGLCQRGRSAGSLRCLEENRARLAEQGRLLHEALTTLLDAAEAKGRRPKAKELQWRLADAGEPGRAYLEMAGYPQLRTVQLHLKVIRAERLQRCA